MHGAGRVSEWQGLGQSGAHKAPLKWHHQHHHHYYDRWDDDEDYYTPRYDIYILWCCPFHCSMAKILERGVSIHTKYMCAIGWYTQLDVSNFKPSYGSFLPCAPTFTAEGCLTKGDFINDNQSLSTGANIFSGTFSKGLIYTQIAKNLFIQAYQLKSIAPQFKISAEVLEKTKLFKTT